MCILKLVKNTHGLSLLVKLLAEVCNFTKSNNSPWVFLTILKLYKWYQIVQSISNKVLALHLAYEKFRSSRSEVLCKKDGKFCKIHRKTTVPESLFNRTATLLKKKLWRKCFPVNVAKFLRTLFLPEHL